MQVKGTAVVSIPEFVRSQFGNRYDEWVNSLTPVAKEIFEKKILASSWYPYQYAVVEPTSQICDLFFSGNERGAWEGGRFSADFALKGVYKVFVKVGSPQFLISRGSKVFSSYYAPSRIEFTEIDSKHVIMRIVEFSEPKRLVECRIAGWMERALEISGCSDVDIQITASMAKGDSTTDFTAKWS